MQKSDTLVDLRNSQRVIYASIAGGCVVFAGKLMVVHYCGGLGAASDSIVAETAHSFVDVMNQCFLLVGIKRSQRPVSDRHPRGEPRPPTRPLSSPPLWRRSGAHGRCSSMFWQGRAASCTPGRC